MSKADDAPSEAWHEDLDKGWTNPFSEGTWLHTEFERVVSQEQDFVIIIDDYNADRGTGKSIASLQLGNGMDQTDEGLVWSKVHMDPQPFRNAYAREPLRSGLVLDEGEVGAGNRDGMTKTNKALREIMSMGRVEQKYVIVNTPAKEFIDKDLLKLAHVWISMTKRGEGIVHALDRQPYSERLLTPKKQLIEFKDVPGDHDLREVYRKLTRMKRRKIQGEDGDSWIPQDEHQEQLRKAREKAKKEMRDEMIQAFYQHPETEASQRIVGECVDLTQQQIGNILNGR